MIFSNLTKVRLKLVFLIEWSDCAGILAIQGGQCFIETVALSGGRSSR